MKKILFLALILGITFGLGYAFNDLIAPKPALSSDLKRVTSIGGVFFKCKNPKQVREWYQMHLGLNVNQYGSVFEWRQASDSTLKGYTQWSPFKESTTYFEPSTKDFMINYRVADLEQLITILAKEGVTICDTIETASYGKFAHIMDIEGNKIELWEPNDIEFEKLGIEIGSITTK